MQIEAIFQRLPAAANSRPELVRRGRFCNTEFLVEVGDYSCTPELTLETAARVPGAEAIIMDGIGHFPMSENPERFARFLLPVRDRIVAA